MNSATLAFCILAVFGGALVRGYTGFGSSLIWVSSLSLVLPPVIVVPAAYLLEIAASAHLLPRVWRDIEWRSLRWLLLGAFVATPPGVYLLSALPASPLRVAISLIVLGATALMWRGFALKSIPGLGPTVATGLVSGLLNGATGIGGPPVIVFYISSPAAVAVSRASLIAFILAVELFATSVATAHGLVTRDVLVLFGVLVLPMLGGIVTGHRGFIRSDPERFRRHVLVVLAALSVAVLLRAVIG